MKQQPTDHFRSARKRAGFHCPVPERVIKTHAMITPPISSPGTPNNQATWLPFVLSSAPGVEQHDDENKQHHDAPA